MQIKIPLKLLERRINSVDLTVILEFIILYQMAEPSQSPTEYLRWVADRYKAINAGVLKTGFSDIDGFMDSGIAKRLQLLVDYEISILAIFRQYGFTGEGLDTLLEESRVCEYYLPNLLALMEELSWLDEWDMHVYLLLGIIQEFDLSDLRCFEDVFSGSELEKAVGNLTQMGFISGRG